MVRDTSKAPKIEEVNHEVVPTIFAIFTGFHAYNIRVHCRQNCKKAALKLVDLPNTCSISFIQWSSLNIVFTYVT